MSTATPASRREKIALWIIVIAGPIWAETYWKYGRTDMLRDLPPIGAALLSAAGAAVGGWLFAKSAATRLVALFTAALAGFGCNIALQLRYGNVESIGGLERIVTYAMGAAPGIIVGFIATVWLDKRAKKSNPTGV